MCGGGGGTWEGAILHTHTLESQDIEPTNNNQHMTTVCMNKPRVRSILQFLFGNDNIKPTIYTFTVGVIWAEKNNMNETHKSRTNAP